jgi:hypothetical protein
LIVPSLTQAQSPDPRDYEVGYFVPSGTTIINSYLRNQSSMKGRDISAQALALRATHILKVGDLVITPLDVILPIQNVNLYTPLNALPGLNAVPGDLKLTANATGFGDLTYLPTIGHGLTQNAENHTHTWYALTVYITAPIGQFDKTRLLNIGSNRWTINPLIMVGQRFARAFTFEVLANMAMYTSNSEYRVPGNPTLAGMDLKLSQKPSFGAAAHLGVDLHPTFFVGLSYLLAINGKRSFEVAGMDITETDSNTVQTFRLNVGIRATQQTQILVQWNEDFSVTDTPNAIRGRFFGLRLTHVFFAPREAPPARTPITDPNGKPS